MPTSCYTFSAYHRLTLYPFLKDELSITLYTTLSNTLLVLLAIVTMTIVSGSCTALYCTCIYRNHAPCLYFDLYFLLGSGVRIIEGTDNWDWTVSLSIPGMCLINILNGVSYSLISTIGVLQGAGRLINWTLSQQNCKARNPCFSSASIVSTVLLYHKKNFCTKYN